MGRLQDWSDITNVSSAIQSVQKQKDFSVLCANVPKCANFPPWQGKSHSNSSSGYLGETKSDFSTREILEGPCSTPTHPAKRWLGKKHRALLTRETFQVQRSQELTPSDRSPRRRDASVRLRGSEGQAARKVRGQVHLGRGRRQRGPLPQGQCFNLSTAPQLLKKWSWTRLSKK